MSVRSKSLFSFLLMAALVGTVQAQLPAPIPQERETPRNIEVDLTSVAIPEAGLVFTNAHIIDGTGRIIESGSIHIQGGTIVAVEEGNMNVDGAMVVNADGYTIMPAFIDAHRHIIQGDPDAWLSNDAEETMRAFIEAGFTTVVSAGDDSDSILELKEMTETQWVGPRILSSGRVPLAGPNNNTAPPRVLDGVTRDPARFDAARPRWRPTETAPAIPEEEIRARVQEIAEQGHEYVKTNILVSPDGPEIEALRIVTDESEKQGLINMTHAVSIEDTLAAVEAGTHMLNHTPHVDGFLTSEQADIVAESGIPMVSTIGIFSPFYSVDNEPLFRDAQPTPFEDLSSAGTGPVNGRLLAEAGVVYGFGTDVSYHPDITLQSELKTLYVTFSEKDITEILTRNAAIAIHRDDQLGTLEAGKLADIVLVDGNPLINLFDLMNVDVVLKEGEILVDNR